MSDEPDTGVELPGQQAEQTKDFYVRALEKDRRFSVLTTGQVAKLLEISQKAVCKLFDTGSLKGYRIPGSQDRRIPREYFLKYLREQGISFDLFIQEMLVLEKADDVSSALKKWLGEVGLGPDFRMDTASALDENRLEKAKSGGFDNIILGASGYPNEELQRTVHDLQGLARTQVIILHTDSRVYELIDRKFWAKSGRGNPPSATMPEIFYEYLNCTHAAIRMREREEGRGERS